VLIGMGRRSYRYRQKERNEVALRARLRELASGRPRFGYQRLCIFPKRENAEEGKSHVGGCDLKQAQGICIVFDWARSCPRADATLVSSPVASRGFFCAQKGWLASYVVSLQTARGFSREICAN